MPWINPSGATPRLQLLRRFGLTASVVVACIIGAATYERLLAREIEVRKQAVASGIRELREVATDPGADPKRLWQQFLEIETNTVGEEFPAIAELRGLVLAQREQHRAELARNTFESLIRAEELQKTSLIQLLEQANAFLDNFAGSSQESDVRRRRAAYLQRLDDRDFNAARTYSVYHPAQFQARIEYYRWYLEKHPSGGSFFSDAERAIESIERDWDQHDFRAVRDVFEDRPGDRDALLSQCHFYLASHPLGRYTKTARELIAWSDQVHTTREYHVFLRSGRFERNIARLFSRGPDLSVDIEVNGIRYGPSTISVNRLDPQWEYEFPRPIRWKLGDPVRIRVTDHDWKDRIVFDISSEDADPLAMRLLSGDLWSGGNRLSFVSDFALPHMAKFE